MGIDSLEIKVSVICPTYNHQDFIATALKSILMQKVDFGLEVLVGEDCSTDSTRSEILPLVEQYPEIVKLVTYECNQGMARNIANLIKLSRGKYIAYCEGDDYWTDVNKLQIQFDKLEEDLSLVAVYTRYIVLRNGSFSEESFGGDAKSLSQMLLIKSNPMPTLSVMFRNKISSIPSDFYKSPISDLFLWSMLGWYGSALRLDNIFPCVYRVHEGGAISLKKQNVKYGMLSRTFWCLFCYYAKDRKFYFSFYFFMKSIRFKSLAATYCSFL